MEQQRGCMKKNFLVYGLVLSGVLLSAAPVAQNVFSTETGFRWKDGVLHGSVPEMPEGVRFFKKGIRTDFPADPYAGKRLRQFLSEESRVPVANSNSNADAGNRHRTFKRRNGTVPQMDPLGP